MNDIINYLYSVLDLTLYKYTILKTKNDLIHLKKTTHHVLPNFSGKNMFLIFKQLDNVFYSVFIEKKTLKYNKTHLNIATINLINLNIKTPTETYNGTIIDGKLINKSTFIINDVFYLEGNNMLDIDVSDKLKNIEQYIKVNFKTKMSFEINKLYTYPQIKDIKNINKLCGLIFYPHKSGQSYLFNFNDKFAHIQLKQRKQPDVYDTYILDEQNNMARLGIAYISTIEMSQYCNEMFAKNKNKNKSSLIFECKFNSVFQKWEPVRIMDNIHQPHNISVIKKLLL